MKILSIGQFSKAIGKSTATLRNWDRENKLKPHHVTEGGTRYYTQEQVNEYLKINDIAKIKDKTVIGYCRVSTRKQKDDLDRQIEAVKTYCLAKGYRFQIIDDIGSGINYNKKGLNELIELIISDKVDKVVVLYKDRLLRFGFELIENLCKKFGVDIEIIDNTPKTDEQELVEDMIQIVTVFSCKLQGKRANKAKKLLSEMCKIDSEEEVS